MAYRGCIGARTGGREIRSPTIPRFREVFVIDAFMYIYIGSSRAESTCDLHECDF